MTVHVEGDSQQVLEAVQFKNRHFGIGLRKER
jgi:hypothetical protein